MIITRTPWAPPEQSVFSFGFKVKLWKVNLIRPLGTLMVHIHVLDGGKFPGKLGLDTTPLDDPLRVTPPAAQATRKTCQVIATVLQDCNNFIINFFNGSRRTDFVIFFSHFFSLLCCIQYDIIICILYRRKDSCSYLHNQTVVRKPEQNSGLNMIRIHDLCDAGAVLYQLSYQANWELVMF